MEYLGLLIAVLIALCAAVGTGEVLAVRGFPVPEPAKRIGCVDGLRGYLALLVMMHHFDLWTNMTRLGAPWGQSTSQILRNFGPGGVALFFMATGLVFYPRIVRGLRGVDWRATYVGRVMRILPLQAVLVAVAFAISAYIARAEPSGGPVANLKAVAMWLTSWSEAPLMGYPNAGAINAYVLWSLWYEWMFYLFVLPAMALLRDVTRDRIPTIVLPFALLAFGLIGRLIIRRPYLIIFLPLFAFGMIAFELRNRESIRRTLCHPVTGIVSALLLIGAMAFLRGPLAMPQMLAYALFFCCIAAGNSFGGLFTLRGSIVLGEISFGIYLIHGTVLFVLFNFIIPSDLPPLVHYATLPVATVVAVLISAAAHLAIERPGIALGRRLMGRVRRPFPPAIERETANLAP